jgi:ankyrin repeat protein
LDSLRIKKECIMNYSVKLISFVCLTVMLAPVGLHTGEIHKAAAAGDLIKVRALIEADSTLLESKDSVGNTPLIIACRTLQVAVANYLIDKGADVNAKGLLKGTSLKWMRKDKDESFDLAQRLIAKGADVNAMNEYKSTVLGGAIASGNLKIAKLLIDHGADLNFRGLGGATILQGAIYGENSDKEMAKFLIESGAKLQEFSFGNTELHLTALQGYADLVPLLVKHGADINAVNEYNHTALYYAAKHGHRKTADALIAAGADKSTIVETDYGKAPQLTETLKEGEAYLWYLGGFISPTNGYAVKTKSHLLIFDPYAIDESSEAGLANGYLNSNELAGQKITVLITRKTSIFGLTVPELTKRIPGTNFVLSFKPTADSAGNNDIPQYHLAVPNESFSVGDIQVHTIPAIHRPYMFRIFTGGDGLGYLVEADGVKIFHTGLHGSSNDSTQLDEYRKEIDFLKPFGPIDIAIVPIKGRHLYNLAYEPYLYMLDQLSPKAVYLAGDSWVTDEHKKCVEVLRARNIPVLYPEGGIAVGERFHYLRKGKKK